MSNLPTRRQRVDRAYQLTLATGASGLATVILAVLAVVGIGGFGLAVVLAIATAVLYLALRRSVGR
jgi:hypothetical protein